MNNTPTKQEGTMSDNREQKHIAQAQQEAVSIKHIREILISKKELHSIIWGETSYEHSGNGVKVLFKGTNKTNPIIKLYVEIDPKHLQQEQE